MNILFLVILYAKTWNVLYAESSYWSSGTSLQHLLFLLHTVFSLNYLIPCSFSTKKTFHSVNVINFKKRFISIFGKRQMYCFFDIVRIIKLSYIRSVKLLKTNLNCTFEKISVSTSAVCPISDSDRMVQSFEIFFGIEEKFKRLYI